MSVHPFLGGPGPVGIAHRGGALEAEENTLEAFDYAVGLGFTHIETDVHATRDGVAVIHHDQTLERLTGRAFRIEDLDYAALAKIRTHEGAVIPRVDEVLASWPDLKIAFELKSDTAAQPLAAAIRAANALERVCVGSFAPRRVAEMRARLGPGLCWSPAHLPVAALWAAGWAPRLRAGGFPVVQVPPRFRGVPVVTGRFVAAARAREVAVQVWTVDEPREMGRMIDLGVHAVMSDRPSVLRDVLRARGAWGVQ
jgi:glycerophosphoryl diester phosphodiesterase